MKTKNKWIIGILIVLALIVVAVYGSTFTVTSEQKESVWVAHWSSAECSVAQADSTIKTYNFDSAKSSTLSNGWLIYRCGYGRLDQDSKQNAYTNRCGFGLEISKESLLWSPAKAYACKNEYNYETTPDKSPKCIPLGTLPSEIIIPQIWETEDLASEFGILEPNGKYTIFAIKIKDGLLGQKTQGKIMVNADKYKLKIKEGNGYSYQLGDCSLKELGILPNVLPSSIDSTNNNTFNGKEMLAFGEIVDWIWAYQEAIGKQAIRHSEFGYIYVDSPNSYIPIKKIDGLNFALERSRINNVEEIECIPNRPNCNPQAKIIKDASKYECSDFKGLKSGDEFLTLNGDACAYKCISGKPSITDCKKVSSGYCNDGYDYSVTEKKCVKITQINPPPISGKPLNLTPLYIILAIGFIAIIMVLIAKKRK